MVYQKMAYVYDQLMMDAPYDQWLQFTEEVFRQSGKKIKNVADLGCGTGEITALLADEGYNMIGIDYSSDMLAYAEQKAHDKKLPIHWLHQDLRELKGLSNLDAAVSYCDVINYITEDKDLEIVFQRVADSLSNGGLFLFDIHSLHHVEINCINQTFADVNDDVSYIWFCTEGDTPGEMHHDLTFFTFDGNSYERFDEYHHQKTYQIDFYKKLLVKAGFENLKIGYDFSLNHHENIQEAERIFFIAEKRSG
ncbi:class I SAM-dependent DNA methyltransferase [Virgibacillus alimentarius]|uniref:SAM-dependent methyltransferase n=1 Tax=Virgibacillus alimentarius TaxID=698769 RepID=A0ABS4S599_9BACI|nr:MULTISPECIES: class I SAM-dependent methyltransferase [Virgibacillus]MBP2256569.1 SAM-dependent methyltransferase [Virgibacillus alimentarius]HLR66515.1 class I SAM-dependent methyltransferase [Virgibacillus sp.]